MAEGSQTLSTSTNLILKKDKKDSPIKYSPQKTKKTRKTFSRLLCINLFYQNLASLAKLYIITCVYAKDLKIASIIITFNRVDEVRAQMDIIRELWQPMFGNIDIYHEYNGKRAWYPKKYKEDFLHRHKQMPHFGGANHMLNQGIKHVLQSKKAYDYIIVTSADTWFYDSKRLKKVILTLSLKRFPLATSLWGGMGLATEFFIMTPSLAKKVFPLKITEIINKYRFFRWAYAKMAIFESIFTIQVMKVLKNPNKIYLIPGRRVVLLKNRYCSPNFYASHHDRSQRRKDTSSNMQSILLNKMQNMPSLNKFLG